jgi:hypothetical protein
VEEEGREGSFPTVFPLIRRRKGGREGGREGRGWCEFSSLH